MTGGCDCVGGANGGAPEWAAIRAAVKRMLRGGYNNSTMDNG